MTTVTGAPAARFARAAASSVCAAPECVQLVDVGQQIARVPGVAGWQHA